MTHGFFQFNMSIINEILNFVISSYDLLFVGNSNNISKNENLQKAIQELQKENLIFQHFCFENTLVDDFLLNFYDALRSFSLAQKISLKKFVTDNFKEKVSHYFKVTDKNCIIIVENFEKVENNIEIIDFLSHLANYNNVKVIIITKNSEKNLFRFKKVKIKTLNFEQLPKDDFLSKLTVLTELKDLRLKEMFYDFSQGKEELLKMSARYCSRVGVLISDLIFEFEKKNSLFHNDFEEFIVSKYISLVPGVHLDYFKKMCAILCPISLEFMEEYKLGTKDYIDYLSKNLLIGKFDNEYYIKDCFKNFVLNSFSIQEKIVYYTNLIEIYENELTKSPKDRLIRLSRETIRKEIENFKELIPTVNSPNKNQKNFMYLGVSSENIWKNEKEKQKDTLLEKFNKIKERKKTLTQEEKETLTLKRLKDSNQESLVELNKEKNRRFIVELLNSAREYVKNYLYKEALEELSRAKTVDEKQEFTIEILILCAKIYENLKEYQTAKNRYSEALELANKTKDSRKCELEFSIAMIHKNLFKTDSAATQFRQIATNEENPQKYRAKAYIELGELYEAIPDFYGAIDKYQNAVELSIGKYKDILCESYYRIAILFDENQDTQNAIKFYQKNYTTSSELKENKYYSICLTNLASIYIEQSKFKEASEYLKLALLFDTENNDWENIYYSQKELAKLYSLLNDSNATIYYKKALDTAKKLNDSFKIALIYFECGEFYYDKQDDKQALIYFLNAKNVLKNNPNDENIKRITSRIKDIKIRLDENSYEAIIQEYDNK